MKYKRAPPVMCYVSGVCCISAEAVISVITVWDGTASSIALFDLQLHCTEIQLIVVGFSALQCSAVQ